MIFDFLRGADQCRSYACKYCGKPEPWYFLPTTGGEANPVKRFLQSRNVGLCMCHNRLLGFHVVRSTVNTQFLWPQFTMDANARVARDPEHCLWNPSYPDAEYYLTEVQKYMFRNEELRHLRLAQFFRYFKHQEDEKTAKKKEKAPAMRTDEDTLNEEDEGAIEDDQCHQNYDLFSSR